MLLDGLFKHGGAVVGYLLVGILWGCSNPFIKHGQQQANTKINASAARSVSSSATAGAAGVTGVGEEGALASLRSLMNTFLRVFREPQIFLPLAVNQSGSFVFYYLLSAEPVSRASPICNALTFVFTALTGHFYFGEAVGRPWLLLVGVLLVLFGILLCVAE